MFVASLLKLFETSLINQRTASISFLEVSTSFSVLANVVVACAVKSLKLVTDCLISAIIESFNNSFTILFVSVRDSAALYCKSIKSAILIGSTIV